MKYVITEQQYQDYRKSIILRFLRRVSHRLDGIIDDSINHILNFFLKRDLEDIGESGFTDRVVFDAFEYIYDSYIENDVEFDYDEQDIIRDYIRERYSNHIRDKYLTHMKDDSKINESNTPKRSGLKKYLQELINETLQYIKNNCDKPYSETPPDIFDEACDIVDAAKEIKILNINADKLNFIMVYVNVIYNSIEDINHWGKLLSNISVIIDRKTGLDVLIMAHQTENLNQNL
jgi:hypothetical protein